MNLSSSSSSSSPLSLCISLIFFGALLLSLSRLPVSHVTWSSSSRSEAMYHVVCRRSSLSSVGSMERKNGRCIDAHPLSHRYAYRLSPICVSSHLVRVSLCRRGNARRMNLSPSLSLSLAHHHEDESSSSHEWDMNESRSVFDIFLIESQSVSDISLIES